MKLLKVYSVVLKNGSDYTVRAKNIKDAIKRVKAGKGKRVGAYLELESTTRDSAFLLEQ